MIHALNPGTLMQTKKTSAGKYQIYISILIVFALFYDFKRSYLPSGLRNWFPLWLRLGAELHFALPI